MSPTLVPSSPLNLALRRPRHRICTPARLVLRLPHLSGGAAAFARHT
jgi:hypothetical protein